MENKEKYIQRIKKLLAMARNNSSAEEAALALSRAQRLMETHKLTEADADLIDINEASTQKAPSHAEKMPEYMAILAEMVARVFGVKFYTSHGTEQWGKPAKRTIHYYGPDERPQIAAYSFEVLGKQLMKARRDYLSTLRKNIKQATKVARADNVLAQLDELEAVNELFLRARQLMYQSGGAPIENSLNPIDAWLYDAERVAGKG